MYMMTCCPCCMRAMPMSSCFPMASCGQCGHDPTRHGGHGTPSGQPQAQKSCVWDGKETSHGGIHCQNGHAYKCNDGEWIKDTSSNDECSSSSGSQVP